jgi:hypothetical protein
MEPHATTQKKALMGMCTCGCAKANQKCTLKSCQQCCVNNITTNCPVQQHQVGKIALMSGPLVKQLNELLAIPEAERPPLYVQYKGGSRPGHVRPLTPLNWGPRGLSFFAYDDSPERIAKKFLLTRVLNWRDNYWHPN